MGYFSAWLQAVNSMIDNELAVRGQHVLLDAATDHSDRKGGPLHWV